MSSFIWFFIIFFCVITIINTILNIVFRRIKNQLEEIHNKRIEADYKCIEEYNKLSKQIKDAEEKMIWYKVKNEIGE